MKKTIVLLLLLPLLSAAQDKLINKPLRLIETITSDTIKGSSKEIIFFYDHYNRVSSIVNRTWYLQEFGASKTKQWVADTTAQQNFEYSDQQKAPLLRRSISYESSGKRKRSHWDKTELQYFKYENGKRVRDSVLVIQSAGKGKAALKESYITTYEQTDSTVTGVTNFSNSDGSEYYQGDLEFHKNVIAEENAYHLRAHAGWIKNYTYTRFDDKINPFSQLNIASFLINEKIAFSFESAELIKLSAKYENGGTEFNWHLMNQNNPLHSTIKRGDTESRFIDVSSLHYTYDRNKFPVYCTIYIKNISSGGQFANGYLKHFTFRYKK